MHAHDLLIEAGADYLHEGFGFLIGFDGEYPVVEVGEFGGVDFDGVFAVEFDGFWFGDSTGCNGLYVFIILDFSRVERYIHVSNTWNGKADLDVVGDTH